MDHQQVAQQEERHYASVASAHRKQIKFYMEVAVLLMVTFMLIASVLKALFSGGGMDNEHISVALRLLHNVGQGIPLVGAITQCQNGTKC